VRDPSGQLADRRHLLRLLQLRLGLVLDRHVARAAAVSYERPGGIEYRLAARFGETRRTIRARDFVGESAERLAPLEQREVPAPLLRLLLEVHRQVPPTAADQADPVEAEGITGAKVLAPQNPDSSILFKRLSALDGTGMPPLAKSILDDSALSIFKAWLSGMNLQPKPGKPVATTSNSPGLSLKANTPLMLSLAGTDPDGDALDFRISRMPVHGTLEGFGKDLTYVPHPDFAGVDGFTFVVGDGANSSEAGSVQLTVTP